MSEFNYKKYLENNPLLNEGEEVNEKEELTFTPSSGTMAGGTFSLNNRKYELTSPIKDVTIGGRYVTTLPKGTILYNLTGGLLADHESLKKL